MSTTTSGASQHSVKTRRTIVSRLMERAERTPNEVALREKDWGIWQQVTWAEYWDWVSLVGHALLSLGVERGNRVSVHSENRREWLFADLGTVAVGGITVGLYPTNPADEVAYLLKDCGATVHVVEDQEQLDKVLEVGADLPALRRIIYLESRGIEGQYDDPRLMSWAEMIDLGRTHQQSEPEAIDRRGMAARESDVITLVYTSGTTGPPKGAMLTHANAEFAIEALADEGGWTSPPATSADLMLSYLPLCHGAERIFTTWFNLSRGVQVHFAESIATVQPDLREIQPTVLFAVPRIWEKLLAEVRIRVSSTSGVKQRLTRFWLRVATRIGDELVASGGRHTLATRTLYLVGWLMCYRALRARLGLRRVRFALSGAAPIAPEVLQFFMGIGVPMYEAYGLTESTGAATSNRPGDIKLGTVGKPQPGVELRLDAETSEVLIRHAGVFAGYWGDPGATSRAVDEDGWLHTGDVGAMVDQGYLQIVDRMKDIVITAGGKNIAPSEIENALKASEYIREAVMIADRRPFPVALIGIEFDTVADWAGRNGIAYTTYRDLSTTPEVVDLVQLVLDQVNPNFATVAQIKKFRLLPKELDHEDGELTATQKVKRSALAKAFGDLVESMYAPTTTAHGRSR